MQIELYQGDNLAAAQAYRGPAPIQLLLWSTPYPGLRGFKVSAEEYLEDWLPKRVAAWGANINPVTGVYAQVVRFGRVNGYYDLAQLQIGQVIEKAGDMRIVELAIWDKVNAPPSGNMARTDRNAYEFIFIAVKSDRYTYHPYRAEYAEKTKAKAAAALRPEYQLDIFGNSISMAGDYRQSDLAGSLAGGHSELNEGGAAQDNIFRISATGEEKRPRVKGGSYPLALARRLILQYSKPGDIIADPCLGAGTSLVEAIRTGRQGLGVEINPRRFDTAADWLEVEAVRAGGYDIVKATL